MTADPVPDTALAALDATIADRIAAARPQDSYVAALAARGVGAAARKLGEEAVEAIVAALDEDDAALVGEAADVLFHLLLLLRLRGLGLDAVTTELVRRHGTSGLAEKAARGA